MHEAVYLRAGIFCFPVPAHFAGLGHLISLDNQPVPTHHQIKSVDKPEIWVILRRQRAPEPEVWMVAKQGLEKLKTGFNPRRKYESAQP